MYPIFLETLGEIQFNGGDPKYHDHHQECQDDQECPPSTGRFLMTISPPRPHVSYIFGNLGQNPVQWRWPQASWSPSGMSRWSGMSPKYMEDLYDYFSQRPYVSYISRNLEKNPVQLRWPKASWSPSGMSRWSRMSSKYREVLAEVSSQTRFILYFWKPWAISWSMEMTPSIMINIGNYIKQLKNYD